MMVGFIGSGRNISKIPGRTCLNAILLRLSVATVSHEIAFLALRGRNCGRISDPADLVITDSSDRGNHHIWRTVLALLV